MWILYMEVLGLTLEQMNNLRRWVCCLWRRTCLRIEWIVANSALSAGLYRNRLAEMDLFVFEIARLTSIREGTTKLATAACLRKGIVPQLIELHENNERAHNYDSDGNNNYNSF